MTIISRFNLIFLPGSLRCYKRKKIPLFLSVPKRNFSTTEHSDFLHTDKLSSIRKKVDGKFLSKYGLTLISERPWVKMDPIGIIRSIVESRELGGYTSESKDIYKPDTKEYFTLSTFLHLEIGLFFAGRWFPLFNRILMDLDVKVEGNYLLVFSHIYIFSQLYENKPEGVSILFRQEILDNYNFFMWIVALNLYAIEKKIKSDAEALVNLPREKGVVSTEKVIHWNNKFLTKEVGKRTERIKKHPIENLPKMKKKAFLSMKKRTSRLVNGSGAFCMRKFFYAFHPMYHDKLENIGMTPDQLFVDALEELRDYSLSIMFLIFYLYQGYSKLDEFLERIYLDKDDSISGLYILFILGIDSRVNYKELEKRIKTYDRKIYLPVGVPKVDTNLLSEGEKK